MAEIIIVDEKDDIIGYKERRYVERDNIYRVSALWITNSKGDVLLAKRGLNKRNNPGKWGPAVAGTVEKGEDYETNIIKEAKEELGLEDIKFNQGLKIRVSGDSEAGHNFFCQWFTLNIDKPSGDFKIQQEELEEVGWFSVSELINLLKEKSDEFIPSMKKHLKLFYEPHFPEEKIKF